MICNWNQIRLSKETELFFFHEILIMIQCAGPHTRFLETYFFLFFFCKSQEHDIKSECSEVLYACANPHIPVFTFHKCPSSLFLSKWLKNANLIMLLPCLKTIPDTPLPTAVFLSLFLERGPCLQMRAYVEIQWAKQMEARVSRWSGVGPDTLCVWLPPLSPLTPCCILWTIRT